MLGILVVVLVLGMSHAQTTVPDSCPPDVVKMQNFDIKQFTGRWYAQSFYPTMIEVNFSCMLRDYQPQLNGEVSVKTSHVENKETIDIIYKEYVVGPGRISIPFELAGWSGTIDEWILDTDYKTYSVIYSCYEFADSYIPLVGIYTRQRMVSEAYLKPAYDVLLKHGLEVKALRRRDQSHCHN